MYGDTSFLPGLTNHQFPDGSTWRVARRRWRRCCRRTFLRRGSGCLSGWPIPTIPLPEGPSAGLESEEHWRHFFADTALLLSMAGWRIDAALEFRHCTLAPDARLRTWKRPTGGFGRDLGLASRSRQRVDLAPLLARTLPPGSALARPAALATIGRRRHGRGGECRWRLASRCRWRGIKPLARTLIDLRSGLAIFVPRAGCRPPCRRAGRRLRRERAWNTVERRWCEWLRGVGQVAAVRTRPASASSCGPSASVSARLQHLRTTPAASSLTDMGLGKTAPDACSPVRREAREAPSTSPRWWCCRPHWYSTGSRRRPVMPRRCGAESARQRSAGFEFERILEHDACLTTYPLLWRDREALAAHEYFTDPRRGADRQNKASYGQGGADPECTSFVPHFTRRLRTISRELCGHFVRFSAARLSRRSHDLPRVGARRRQRTAIGGANCS